MRPCRVCGTLKKPIGENFFFGYGSAIGRICKVCLDKKLVEDGRTRTCKKCGREKLATKEYFPTNRGRLLHTCKECVKQPLREAVHRYQIKYPRRVWESGLVANAKRRACKTGLDLDEKAIRTIMATYKEGTPCPCCGIAMGAQRIKNHNRWPSLDRINPQRGYIVGNLAFICYRCNVLKSDGTIQEFKNIIHYLEKNLGPATRGRYRSGQGVAG